MREAIILDGKWAAGRVFFDGTSITITTEPGFEDFMRPIQADWAAQQGRDPGQWFESLASRFPGAHRLP
jgi:hypothetical protein